MNKFKFFRAMLLAGAATLASYGCSDNQADTGAKKADEKTTEVQVQEDAAAKQMAIYAQAEEALNSFITDVRNNRIQMGGAIRNRVLNYNNEMMSMITESYVMFCGNSNGEQLSFHIVKTNGVWKCDDIEPDWDVIQELVK